MKQTIKLKESQLRQLVTETIKIIIRENNSQNIYTLYHSSQNENFDINNINDNNIWLATEPEYSENFNGNLYEIKIKLNNILDTYKDFGNTKHTLKYYAKYLKQKNVNTSDFEYVSVRDYNTEKYIFWELISKHSTINYNWLAIDIFHAGYDAIKLFEYGYSKKEKGTTFLINNPKNKIISVKKLY